MKPVPMKPTAMKPAQWTAVLILALMVGGISFISVYLGGANRGGVALPSETQPSLSFPIKLFPQEGEKAPITEVRHTGHQDFWFTNPSGQDVDVGLIRKNCKCSEVEITVAAASFQAQLIRLAVTQALPPPSEPANLSILAAACYGEHWDRLVREDGATSKMLTEVNSATVPAGAIGRVRLSWRREQKEILNTYAELWMGQRGGSVSARLETNVRISEPLELSKDLSIAAVSERALEAMKKGLRATIVCYSLTRPAFDIQAKMLHRRLPAESDPVELGEPIPLTPAELLLLEKSAQMHMLTVLSGYRIPLRVRARAKDGTPIEWGHFHRVVQLSSSDDSIEPAQVKVTGEVLGDITVGGGTEAGMIDLGPFPRSRGAHGKILLQSDEKGIDLELDAARKPEYLNAALGKPKETGGGHRQWVLSVEVPPNAAFGEFPRADDPVYRDSAIYVKTTLGKTRTSQRSMRIPVLGVANDDRQR
ncbi:MAG TPA: hypothetical protein VMF69_06025 [Gemmataceae bacterium]|nr:hypothetical protein [Gemmataceae bacterium]